MTRQELISLLVEEALKDYSGDGREAKDRRMKIHIAAGARKRGLSGKRYRAYVYGAMRRAGWKPKREREDG